VKNKNGGHNDPRGFRDGTTHLGSGSHSRQTAVLDREMPEDDVTGMIAYLDVLTCMLSDGAGGGDGRGHDSRRGTDALFQSRVAWLEQRSGCDLLDQLLRLHANPVPATLKAQLLRCVHAIAVTDAGSANEVWGLLEQQAVLQSNDHPGGGRLRSGEGKVSGVPRPSVTPLLVTPRRTTRTRVTRTTATRRYPTRVRTTRTVPSLTFPPVGGVTRGGTAPPRGGTAPPRRRGSACRKTCGKPSSTTKPFS
jgi:hypothetical protein